MESFGVLLRRHRMAAVLTQERLAERARISATGIAALEAGRRKVPRPSTVALLLDALELTDDARAEMIAAASGSVDIPGATARSGDAATRGAAASPKWTPLGSGETYSTPVWGANGNCSIPSTATTNLPDPSPRPDRRATRATRATQAQPAPPGHRARPGLRAHRVPVGTRSSGPTPRSTPARRRWSQRRALPASTSSVVAPRSFPSLADPNRVNAPITLKDTIPDVDGTSWFARASELAPYAYGWDLAAYAICADVTL